MAKRYFFFLPLQQCGGKENMNNQFIGGCEPPIPWIGGKSILLPVLRRLIPPYPQKYLETFGGGGAMTCSGRIAPTQIYNDKNSKLVNFMRVLQSRADELINHLLGVFNSDGTIRKEFAKQFFFNSRDQFIIASNVFYHSESVEDFFDQIKKASNKARTHEEKIHTMWLISELIKEYEKRANDPELWDAVHFFILMKCSYAATGTSWAIKPVNAGSIARILNHASRMFQNIIIENKDCIELIKFHDSESTFIYNDPPYYMAEDLYKGVDLFDESKHRELHDTLNECKSKVLLSYNDCPYIDSLYSEDKWEKIRVARPNSMVLRNGPGALYYEIIIANYNIRDLYKYGTQTTFFDELEPMNNEGRIIL